MEQMVAEYLDRTTEEVLSNEQLRAKINAFRSLYAGNKINCVNAFELNMTECFHEWLKKKKCERNLTEDTLFQDLPDYLDTTAKIYGYRVDHVNKEISGLVNNVKTDILKKNTDDMDEHTEQLTQVKTKASKMMLTTDDKLRGKPIDSYTRLDIPLDLKQLRSVANPSQYILSMFNNTSFEEELKESRENCKNKPNIGSKGCYTMPDIGSILTAGAICPQFSGFLAKRDRTPNTTENSVFECIEEHFDPENNPLKDCTINLTCEETNSVIDNQDESGSNSNNRLFNELLECVDTGRSDYSFFNPRLLANWSGPKAWKDVAMAQSLRSLEPNKRCTVPSSKNGVKTYEQPIPNTKFSKNVPKVSKKLIKVKWLNRNQIDSMLEKNITSLEELLPQTIRKWNFLKNCADPPPFKIKHKFSFLECLEIEPDLVISQRDAEKKIDETESSHEKLTLNDCQNNDEDIFESVNNENNNADNISQEPDDKEGNIDENDDEDVLLKETKMDVADLKCEMLDIIDQQCIFTPSNNEWSNSLTGFELLRRLRCLDREELSVPLAFVTLLHLCNEKGLKLEKYNSTDEVVDMYISKPKKYKN